MSLNVEGEKARWLSLIKKSQETSFELSKVRKQPIGKNMVLLHQTYPTNIKTIVNLKNPTKPNLT